MWGEGFSVYLKKKKFEKFKISKKKFACFLFSTVTIYRLYHTHSLGSVEPTIALSESLWSRIVTQKFKKNQKNKNFKKKIFTSVCVLYCFCDFQHQ